MDDVVKEAQQLSPEDIGPWREMGLRLALQQEKMLRLRMQAELLQRDVLQNQKDTVETQKAAQQMQQLLFGTYGLRWGVDTISSEGRIERKP